MQVAGIADADQELLGTPSPDVRLASRCSELVVAAFVPQRGPMQPYYCMLLFFMQKNAY